MRKPSLRAPSRSTLSKLLRSHLCKDCLAATTRRSFSTPSTSPINPPSPPPTGFARLTNRALILVHGRDAAHYLQGLTTSNIKDYTYDLLEGRYTAFLNAQGRILYDVFIYPIDHALGFGGEYIESVTYDEPGFMIDVDKRHAETLRSHLKRYKLRAKIGIRVAEPDEYHVYATWDDNPPIHPPNKAAPPTQNFGCIDTRAPGMGKRILSFADFSKLLHGEQSSAETYDVRRILKGVPEGADEIIPGEALPQESNIDYMSGVDFRKGCYVGQELTIRTHHTGVVRKRILPVQLYGPDEEQPPDVLRYDPKTSVIPPSQPQNIARVNTKGRSAGKFLRGVGNIGLALCRLETMTDVRVAEGGQGQWSAEHEFKMAWQVEGEEGSGEAGEEKEVKIKAFVPEWHRNRPSVRDMHRQQQDG
ncbi:MAG: hypothetical protein L6R40_001514 [Gallowayella cf. fulva]|nr:MAG: hypothetical protein L6R40_001514 [Xanthomendoza cf. fulva]